MARGKKGSLDKIGPTSLTSSEIAIVNGRQKMRSRGEAYYRRMAIFKRAIVVIVVLAFVLLISSLAMSLGLRKTLEDQVSDTYNPAYKVRHDDLGAAVIDSWFTGGTPIVNTAAGVTWPTSDYETLPAPGNVPVSVPNPQDQEEGAQVDPSEEDPEAEAEEAEPYSTTIRSVSFVRGGETELSDDSIDIGDSTFESPTREELTYYAVLNNQPVYITVVFLIQGGSPGEADTVPDPVMLAAPSVSGVPNSQSEIDASTAPRGQQTNKGEIPEASRGIVSNWAKAYAQNDTDILRQLAADSETSTSYTGIGGWTVLDEGEGSITTNWWYTLPDNDDDIVAEITFDMYQIVPTGSNQDEDLSDPDVQSPDGFVPFKTTQTMTVLIQDAESGNPSISSWGPPGAAENLEPYSAAVIEEGN